MRQLVLLWVVGLHRRARKGGRSHVGWQGVWHLALPRLALRCRATGAAGWLARMLAHESLGARLNPPGTQRKGGSHSQARGQAQGAAPRIVGCRMQAGDCGVTAVSTPPQAKAAVWHAVDGRQGNASHTPSTPRSASPLKPPTEVTQPMTQARSGESSGTSCGARSRLQPRGACRRPGGTVERWSGGRCRQRSDGGAWQRLQRRSGLDTHSHSTLTRTASSRAWRGSWARRQGLGLAPHRPCRWLLRSACLSADLGAKCTHARFSVSESPPRHAESPGAMPLVKSQLSVPLQQ